MGSGRSGLYQKTRGADNSLNNKQNKPVNGKDYNSAGSASIKKVDTVSNETDSHHISFTGIPNSVLRITKNDSLTQERYYGEDGKPYLDIDYTNHGNAKLHPNVPHEHKWIKNEDGTLTRLETEGAIKK
ncbi:hypothetical protein [uncultured Dialister sp.]|uniref:hypothetical protein n=1 Tax=uncultured Dialister sp. TaxID=278064 RepID=UPI0025DA4F50|nr:hypothetical protein [uncultured Dialister sp.]